VLKQGAKMKLVKTASGKIKISKTEWEAIGKKTGWIKEAGIPANQMGSVPGFGNVGMPNQPTPQATQSGQQLSESAVDAWIMKTDPALMPTWERALQQKDQNTFALFQKALGGDQQALSQLKNAGQAIPVAPTASSKKTMKKAEMDDSTPCKCKECGKKTTLDQCMSEAGVWTGCPFCGSKNVEKNYKEKESTTEETVKEAKKAPKKCRGCGKDIWDVSTVDQRLNKCHECGLEFDNDEGDDEDEETIEAATKTPQKKVSLQEKIEQAFFRD